MAPRMLCTDCEITARPDTRLPGSDLGEMLGFRRARTRRKACRAWDTSGRPLSVELVGGA